MSVSLSTVGAQGLSVLDPAVPWMLAILLALSGLGLHWYWQPERRALRPHGPASRLPGSVAGAIMLCASMLFAGLAWSVLARPDSVSGQVIGRWDSAALLWAQGLTAGGLYAFAVKFTEVGSLRFLMSLVGLVALWLLYYRAYFTAAACVVSCSANGLLLRALKLIFERDRPPHDLSLSASGYGFPSGHAAGAAMVIGLLTWLLCDRIPPQWRILTLMLGCLLIASISASRVLLQVHYLTDVLAGLLLGAFTLTLTIAIMEYTRENRPKS